MQQNTFFKRYLLNADEGGFPQNRNKLNVSKSMAPTQLPTKLVDNFVTANESNMAMNISDFANTLDNIGSLINPSQASPDQVIRTDKSLPIAANS